MAMMTVERLHELLDENSEKGLLVWSGTCHDCGCEVKVAAIAREDGIHIKGGSVYEPELEKFFIKCDTCFSKDPLLKNYQNCEVYSRVVGYLRPVNQWNDAKQAEFKDRALFDSSMM